MSVHQWSAEETNALLTRLTTKTKQKENSMWKKCTYMEIVVKIAIAGFNRSANQFDSKLEKEYRDKKKEEMGKIDSFRNR